MEVRRVVAGKESAHDDSYARTEILIAE